MLETGVGRAFNVALASSKFIDSPGDTSPNDRYFSRDIVKNPFKMMDGVIDANDGPGIGIQIDTQYLKKVEKERIKLL
jgi:O-succinylbenzoate synthase